MKSDDKRNTSNNIKTFSPCINSKLLKTFSLTQSFDQLHHKDVKKVHEVKRQKNKNNNKIAADISTNNSKPK